RLFCRTTREFFGGANGARTRYVNVDIRLVFRIPNQCMSMGSPTGLDGRHLPGFLEVADIENANASKTLGADGCWNALKATVDSSASLLSRHEEQVSINGDVALTTRAYDGRDDPCFPGIFDRIRSEAVIIAHENPVAAKSQ